MLKYAIARKFHVLPSQVDKVSHIEIQKTLIIMNAEAREKEKQLKKMKRGQKRRARRGRKR